MEVHSEMGLIRESFDSSNLLGRLRDDDYESQSESDNFDGGFGDDQDAGDDQPQRKKKYHRHSPKQIQELEAFFKECPHPDEQQRIDLSKRLGLEIKQVKFWFQNRRTQMKTHLERQKNMTLKHENNKLQAENVVMKEALANPLCKNCGGPTIPSQISSEEHQTRVENARLKDELNRTYMLANKFLGQSILSLASPMSRLSANSSLECAIGINEMGSSSNFGMPMPIDFNVGDELLGSSTTMPSRSPMAMMENEIHLERSMLIDIAINAMDELVTMAQQNSPLWIKSSDGGKEELNCEQYVRMFSGFVRPKPIGYVTEATRATGVVLANSLGLVEILINVDRWSEMFSSIVASACTLNVLSEGMDGTRNGALQVMLAEVQLLSPLVPTRKLSFLRFCKQHSESVWVVVDVSVDIICDASNSHPLISCRKLPSGCIIQDMFNGFSKITWVEHSQYDESVIHQRCRPLVSSGIGFGAQRWIATLLRQCDCLATLMSPPGPSDNSTAFSQLNRKSVLKLAQRMTEYFCSGICASSKHKWDVLHIGNLADDVTIMARKSLDDPNEAPGIVLCASTTVWMPVSRQRVFDFLRNEKLRGEWDMLSNGGPMKEMLHVPKGQEHGNCVSIFHYANDESNELYLQESWTDASGSMVAYSPINMHSLNMMMSCGDSSFVALRPSGFAILPDGNSNNSDNSEGGGSCLLTVELQMLQNDNQSVKFTMESVQRVNSLLSCTIQKVKHALRIA